MDARRQMVFLTVEELSCCSCRRTKMAQLRSTMSVFYSFHCVYWFDNRLQILLTRVPISHLETDWLPMPTQNPSPGIEMGFCSPDNGMATFHIQPMDILSIKSIPSSCGSRFLKNFEHAGWNSSTCTSRNHRRHPQNNFTSVTSLLGKLKPEMCFPRVTLGKFLLGKPFFPR